MQNMLYHTGDDELLLLLLDAPNRWEVKCGEDSAPVTTLRHALRKAHEFSRRGDFSGYIVKQPNNEVVVDADQIFRLCQHLEFEMSSHTFSGPTLPSVAVFSRLENVH